MQVASTLWPDIKSQKISEYRFRLIWTKCSPRTTPNPLKTGQHQCGQDKAAQDNTMEEFGGGWCHCQADRPAWSADRPVGPTALCLLRGDVSLAHNIGLLRIGSFSPVAPCYKYKGGGWRMRTHTHTHTHTSSHSPLA